MYERLLYTSRAGEEVAVSDVYDIIRTSHNRNSTHGLTGGLLFLDGYFLQVLEGSPYALEQRYRRIAIDPRHQDVELRLRQADTELLFPTDWMALRSTHDIDPEVFAKHHYIVGVPKDRFDGKQVLEFMLDCFISV